MTPSLRYLSVCSGIEAVTVAWRHLDFQAVYFSEIDMFPCAVLTHHYPDIPNLGDMTNIDGKELYGKIDIIVGGTPCQDFSIAGKRRGLGGERSGLARHFIRLCNEARPRWFIWENVPGCMSTNKGEDFKNLLNMLEKCGYSIAYRILDAQGFGVPQRRRRVFVVGHLGRDWRQSAAVLFESEGMCRNTSAIQKTRAKDSRLAGTLSANGGGTSRPAGNRNELDFCVPFMSAGVQGVRRFTPLECERLQGFPDNYTNIFGASDSQRYKALGNSMAVPVMRWIGERIKMVDKYDRE